MLRSLGCLALTLALLFLATSATAQEPRQPGHLLARTRRARLEVVFGRIRLTKVTLGRQSVQSVSEAETGIEERLSFSAKSSNSARLCYQYLDTQQQLLIDIEQVAEVTIERLPRGDSDTVAVRLRQPLRGDLTLSVEDEGNSYEVSAASLWHLLLAEPDICGAHLVPILQSLRTDWLLDTQTAQVEAALLAAARCGRVPDTARMNQLVQQLGHPKFSRRQAAHHELRQLGQTAVAFLERLDEHSLQVEQRTRVRQLKRSLQLNTGDTPMRVASWLVDDKAVWLSLLERENPMVRQLATRHLGAITGQSLAFDPKASPAERRGQIHRLRDQWDLDRPILVGSVGDDLRR